MRTNLLSLQNISRQVERTQQRLSTGNKVNSAIDNPSSYYTARSLSDRADDLSALLDSMGQAMQTIKAATEGIESATNLVEQMQSIAGQALIYPAASAGGEAAEVRPVEDLVAEGYQVVSAGMTAAEIEALLTDGAKVVLAEDVVLDRGLNITAANVVLDGNGHKLTYNASAAGEAAVAVNGSGASVDIKNLGIEASGEQVYGIAAQNGGAVTLDNTQGIKVSGTGAQKIWFRDEALYDGKGNTDAILAEIGADALAATAANQFYVGDKNGEFGQGNWYLPSIGELMNVYGTDTSAMTGGYGTSGMTGANKTIINNTLTTLANSGAEAATLTNGYYWSSSEYSNYGSWGLTVSNGYRGYYSKYDYGYVRVFQLVENCFDPLTLSADASGGGSGAAVPEIGYVMYDDKTWGSADDYAAAKANGKTAVGVVTEVLEDGSVKIMNLKDLTFSSNNTVGNFNPDNPYGGSVKYTYHTTSAKYSQDVTGVPNYDSTKLLNASKSGGTINISFTASAAGGGSSGDGNAIDAAYATQYNNVLAQYDMLINDSSYKGVNLLRADSLEVRFNEYRTSGLKVEGTDISAAKIGLSSAEWKSIQDVAASIAELSQAVSTLRSLVGEFGNNYSIITNRESFTENLINILTEGADKLVLADMNEESANMLALQTRQQLAVNSLSLASQSSQAVLKLF